MRGNYLIFFLFTASMVLRFVQVDGKFRVWYSVSVSCDFSIVWSGVKLRFGILSSILSDLWIAWWSEGRSQDWTEKFVTMSSRLVTVMNRAKRGLYGGRHIQFGNKVSEDGGNKSRRTWKPNVQAKRLFSLALDKYIRVNVTMHALRCIDKAGGIDEYLLNIPDRKVENDIALFWKHQIAAVYQRLANSEIAIPVQAAEESTFSMEVFADALLLPSAGDSSKNSGKPIEVKVTEVQSTQ